MKMNEILDEVLRFIASLCMEFDVDWEKEYEDDAYVLELRERRAEQRNYLKALNTAPAAAAK